MSTNPLIRCFSTAADNPPPVTDGLLKDIGLVRWGALWSFIAAFAVLLGLLLVVGITLHSSKGVFASSTLVLLALIGTLLCGLVVIGRYLRNDDAMHLLMGDTRAEQRDSMFKFVTIFLTTIGAMLTAFITLGQVEQSRDQANAQNSMEIRQQLYSRFQDASLQIGGETPALRISGLASLGSLADEWLLIRGIEKDCSTDAPCTDDEQHAQEQADLCIDTIINYLRIPIPLASGEGTTADHDIKLITELNQDEVAVRRSVSLMFQDHLVPNSLDYPTISVSPTPSTASPTPEVDLPAVGPDAPSPSMYPTDLVTPPAVTVSAVQSAPPTPASSASENTPRWSYHGFDFSGTYWVEASFQGALLSHDVTFFDATLFVSNFESAVFAGTVDFSYSRWRGANRKELDHIFEGTIFRGQTSFENADFQGFVNFSDAFFFDETNFRYTLWGNLPGNAPYASNCGRATFDRASFGSSVVFDNSHFDLSRTTWDLDSTGLSFRQVFFGAEASFESTQFGGLTTFANSHFIGQADFGNSTWTQQTFTIDGHDTLVSRASFVGAAFLDRAIFDNASFMGDSSWLDDVSGQQYDAGPTTDTSFKQVVFASDVTFKASVFSGTVSYADAFFNKVPSFADTRFSVDFAGNWFSVNFINTSFREGADFTTATFVHVSTPWEALKAVTRGDDNQRTASLAVSESITYTDGDQTCVALATTDAPRRGIVFSDGINPDSTIEFVWVRDIQPTCR